MNKHPDELADLEGTTPKKTGTPNVKRPKKKFVKKEGNLYSTELEGSLVLNDHGNLSTSHVSTSNIDHFGESPHVEKSRLKKVSRGPNVNSTATDDKPVTLVVQGTDGENCTIEV